MKTFFSTNVLRCTTQLTKEFEIKFQVLLSEDGLQRLELARA